MSREEHKDAIEVSIIFHEGQRMFAVPKRPAPVPLTDEQINELRQQYGVTSDGRGIKEFTYVVDFARAILAAAQPAPVQPVGVTTGCASHEGFFTVVFRSQQPIPDGTDLYTTPPAAPVQEDVGMPDDFRQDRDISTAQALFSNLKKHGEQSALTAAFAHLWPSAFSHGFQSAKVIYTTTTPPAAQPAPVQEPVGDIGWGGSVNWHKAIPEFGADLYTTPPSAQRPWVGLTDDAKLDLISDAKGIGGRVRSDAQLLVLLDMQEAKLKEKNNG
jgi:hypothetical protein